VDWVEAAQLETLDVELYYSTEWDEFWSFVGCKSNIRWTWYVIEKRSGVILAWQNGRRTDEVLKQLLRKVAHLPICISHTDDWGAYSRLFPSEYLHIIGKDNTWKIERKNLNFRTHIKRLSRRTICFSKNETIHDNVIGMYIEKYYFKHGQFADAFRA
jgi:insertion element IS1 protein InsB